MTAPNLINISSYLVDMAARQPNTDALLTSPRRDSHGKLSYIHTTYRQLNDESDSLAEGLACLGITQGTRTALLLKPGIDFFVVTFALFKLGAIPVLIDPGIGLKNFGKCLEQAQPNAFIGIPLAHLLRRLLGWYKKTIKFNITTGTFGGIALQKLKRPRGSKLPFFGLQSLDANLQTSRPAAILFTSGSTGPAKGVLYTHANFQAQIDALKAIYNIEPGEIDLATFPLFALFGPALGMTTVLPDMNFTRPGFVDPKNIIDPIQQLNITNMFGSPALIERVGRFGSQHNIKLPSLRRVISAGAPASAPSLERFSTMLSRDTQIFTPYGATEALPVASIGSHEILTHTRQLTDTGHGVCVGTPAPNIQVRIIKITDTPIPTWSNDLELPQGQIGEIIVQGPAVTTEYFHRPDATALAKIVVPTPSSGVATKGTPDPSSTPIEVTNFYHRMGDCGYLDPQGRLWFVGRKSQRVRLATGDLHSIPVEAIFNTHPNVRRSALVGVSRADKIAPVVCIELDRTVPAIHPARLKGDLHTLAGSSSTAILVMEFLLHPSFPVDIRHNAKINRELLAQWAQRKLK